MARSVSPPTLGQATGLTVWCPLPWGRGEFGRHTVRYGPGTARGTFAWCFEDSDESSRDLGSAVPWPTVCS